MDMHLSVVRAGIAGIIFCTLGTAGSAQTPNVKLMLDFSIQGQQSPFVLAAEGGYFARAGVNVEVDRGYGSADAITKVAGRAYDMAFADIGAMIQFNGKHTGAHVISVFQVYDVAPMLILSLKKSNIAKPSDLVGKRLASPPGASSRVMFPLFAAATGLDPSSVSWIDVTPQLRETLLAQGRVDAITSLVTDLAGLERLGITENDVAVMRFSDFGVALYGHCILTTTEFAAKNPETVKKVVKGIAEALKAAIADPSLSIAAIKKREPLIDEKLERARLELVIKDAIVTDRVRREGLSAVDPDRMKQTIDMVAKTFNIPPLDVGAIYRPDYLPPRPELQLQ
jgi:NitT/TauT family transport system substrate-binding protein